MLQCGCHPPAACGRAGLTFIPLVRNCQGRCGSSSSSSSAGEERRAMACRLRTGFVKLEHKWGCGLGLCAACLPTGGLLSRMWECAAADAREATYRDTDCPGPVWKNSMGPERAAESSGAVLRSWVWPELGGGIVHMSELSQAAPDLQHAVCAGTPAPQQTAHQKCFLYLPWWYA